MDNSFITLSRTLEKSLSLGYNKTAQQLYHTFIQLSPNEPYLQISNDSEGIAFGGNFNAYIVDPCDNILKDITSNVFIEEFTDRFGIDQIKYEIVNIGQDFFGRAVMIKIQSAISDDVYYTNPLKVTDKNIEKTIRVDYRDYDYMNGIDYSAASTNNMQGIRLAFEFKNTNNNSEASEYYQISTGRNISTRYLEKIGNSYICEQIDDSNYRKFVRLFKNSMVYVDGERVTNKPLVTSAEAKGKSNLFLCDFEAYLDQNDTFDYGYQLFDGVEVVEYIPLGAYTLAGLPSDGSVTFNVPVSFENLTISLYTDVGVLVETFTDADFSVTGNVLTITGFTDLILANGGFYVNVSAGITGMGVLFDPITDSTTWAFTVGDADYSALDYTDDYFIN